MAVLVVLSVFVPALVLVIWACRSDAQACRVAAQTPVRMTRAEYLSQLRRDAGWDAHRMPGVGRWSSWDVPYRFPVCRAREILRELEGIDPADTQAVDTLATRYGARDPKDIYAMRYHPAILTD